MKRLRIYRKMTSYPEGTPLFGACLKCKAVLPYPPIQIPRKPSPATKGEGEHNLKYTIIWDRYCLSCAGLKLRKVKTEEVTPDRVWDLKSGVHVANPYKEGK